MPTLDEFFVKFKAENEVFNRPGATARTVGALPAVTSEANSTGLFEQDAPHNNGKNRKAVFKYLQRDLEADVKDRDVDGAPNFCETGEAPLYLSDEMEVQKQVYKKFTIPYEDVRGYEESFARVLSDKISVTGNSIVEKLNGKVIAAYEALRGTDADGNTIPQELEGFTNPNDYTINHAFEIELSNMFDDLSYSGNKILVGDKAVKNYMRMLDYGAENSTRGQQNNMRIVNDFMFYNDTMLDQKLGSADNALAWRPGEFQMLEWFKNTGDFKRSDGRSVNDTITLNVNGIAIPMDIYMRYSDCDDETSGLTVTLSKWFDFWTRPSDSFKATDPLFGTNGLLRAKLTTRA